MHHLTTTAALLSEMTAKKSIGIKTKSALLNTLAGDGPR